MPRKDINKIYMQTALNFSEMSYAERKKVGAIVVKDGRIISIGWNGMPSGFDNKCEYEEDGVVKTKPEVMHAEFNAFCKLAKSSESSIGAYLYVTMSPCIECSKMIIQCGISKVFYLEEYRCNDGVNLLNKAGIETKQISL